MHCFLVFLRKTFSHLKYTPTYMLIVVAVGLIRLSYHKNIAPSNTTDAFSM